MNNVIISIIIPVYNCEVYLEQCLESVLQQTIKEIEIICVDDGSSDKSFEILQQYAKQYEYIHVYSQPNSGAGAARNLGLRYATGEYVAFLDADDFYLDHDALEKMYAICKRENVSACGSLGKILEGNRYRAANFYDIRDMSAEKVYNYGDFQFDCGYTTFLFERRIIEENHIRFPEYKRFQDPPFMVRAMYYADRFAMADTQLYCYRAPNLIQRFNQDKIIDMLKGIKDNLCFALEHNLDKLFTETLHRLEYDYVYMILHNLSSESSVKNNEVFFLLQSVNKMVQDYYKDETYLLRVLQMLMMKSASYCAEYEELLNRKIQKLNHIAIYGAGRYAKNFLRYLEEKKLLEKVTYIVVSSRNNNDEKLSGIEVVDIDTFMGKRTDEYIFVAVGAMNHEEIAEKLRDKNFYDFELMDDAFLGGIG